MTENESSSSGEPREVTIPLSEREFRKGTEVFVTSAFEAVEEPPGGLTAPQALAPTNGAPQAATSDSGAPEN